MTKSRWYRDTMLEGGGGYNPYDTERISDIDTARLLAECDDYDRSLRSAGGGLVR